MGDCKTIVMFGLSKGGEWDYHLKMPQPRCKNFRNFASHFVRDSDAIWHRFKKYVFRIARGPVLVVEHQCYVTAVLHLWHRADVKVDEVSVTDM